MLINLNFIRVAACAAVVMMLLWLMSEVAALIVGGVALLFLTGDLLAPVAVSLYNKVRARVRAWMRRK